jgi:hypothetical protein
VNLTTAQSCGKMGVRSGDGLARPEIVSGDAANLGKQNLTATGGAGCSGQSTSMGVSWPTCRPSTATARAQDTAIGVFRV